MQFQFNSRSNVDGDVDMAANVEDIVRTRLNRIQDRITRVEVHIGDMIGGRAGSGDMQCVIELRPIGMAPISASDQAPDISQAVSGAADKALVIFDRQIGKRTDKKGH